MTDATPDPVPDPVLDAVPHVPRTVDAASEGAMWASWTCTVALSALPAGWLVQIRGRLGVAALQPCRAALDQALGRGRPLARGLPLVVDLEGVAHDRAALALVGAMQRYAGSRGARLVIAGAPEPLAHEIRHARLANAVELVTSLPEAVRLLAGSAAAWAPWTRNETRITTSA